MWQQQCEWNKSALGEGDRRHAASEKLVSRVTKARGQFSHSSAPRQKAAGLKLTHFKTVRERGSGASHSLNYLTVWLREHSELKSIQPSLKKKKKEGDRGRQLALDWRKPNKMYQTIFSNIVSLIKERPRSASAMKIGMVGWDHTESQGGLHQKSCISQNICYWYVGKVSDLWEDWRVFAWYINKKQFGIPDY